MKLLGGDTLLLKGGLNISGRRRPPPPPVNQPPIAGADTAATISGGTVTIAVLANDVDPEGGALQVTAASAAQGQVEVNPDGTLDYTAPEGFTGTDTLTYTVSDPAGGTVEGQVAVEVTAPAPVNQPPVAGADTAATVSGGTVTIAVLANDVDPEGGALQVTAANAGQGQVEVNPDGTLDYTAPEGFTGTDTITYTVSDSAGSTVEGQVAVEVIELSITEGGEPGEFVVTSAPGELTVSIIEPVEAAGDYVLVTADLSSGPVNMVPPRIDGTAAPGETLTALSGVWAYAEADSPFVVARQWFRGREALSGETDASYVATAADAGGTLRLVETGTTQAGSRSASSVEVTVSAPQPQWTPAALPGLVAWFDAADAAAVTLSGSEITQWSDKSGNGRHATKQAAAGPGTTTLNGVAAINFAAGRQMQFDQPISGAAPRSIYVAAGFVAGSKRALLGFGAADPMAQYALSGYNSSVLQLGLANGQDLATTRSLEADGIVGFVHDGSTTVAGSSVVIDGSVTTPFAGRTNTVGSAAGTALIGRKHLSSSINTGGPIGEIVTCDVALSEADRQRLEGYLAHKWGFAERLPDAHPHKAAPPAA